MILNGSCAHFQTNHGDSVWPGLGHILLSSTGSWGQPCVNQMEWVGEGERGEGEGEKVVSGSPEKRMIPLSEEILED